MGQLHDATTTGDGTVDMQVGPPPQDQPPAPLDEGSTGRSLWPVLLTVLGVLVVAAAGAFLLGRSGERHEVRVVDRLRGQGWTDAPSAPDRQLAERWSHLVPGDHWLLGVAVGADTVVVATQDRDPAVDEVVVEGLATADGSRQWRETLPGRDTLVVVADEDTSRLLNMHSDSELDGMVAQAPDSLAVLDPTTGTTRPSIELGTEPSSVEVRGDGQLIIRDDSGVAQVDPLTGDTVLAYPHTDSDDGLFRTAWWFGSGWAVPTDTSWEITDGDGQVEFALDRLDGLQVFGDLVINLDDSTATAYHRPGGDQAWQIELPGRIAWLEPLDPPWVDPQTGFHVWVEEEAGVSGPSTDGVNEVEIANTPFLVEDGQLVGPAGGPVETPPWDPWARLGVEIDGEPRTACVNEPEGGPCPGDLALVDPDGEVLASASVDWLHPELNSTRQATDAGLLLHQQEHLGLFRWGDLSEAWSLELGDPWLDRVVLTTEHGVVVATPRGSPERVTWYG